MSIRLPLPSGWGALFAAEIPEKSSRLQHETAHCLLQTGLPEYAKERCISIAETPPVLSFSEYGKPFLTNYPEIRFNLSHCDGLGVCLFSEHDCGADCEGIRKYKPRVAQRVCSPEELTALESAEDRDMLFTRLWTLKESYVKAIGIGISYPLREVSFAFAGERITPNRKDASFLQILLPEHIVSVCVLKAMGEQRVIQVKDGWESSP